MVIMGICNPEHRRNLRIRCKQDQVFANDLSRDVESHSYCFTKSGCSGFSP